MRRVKPRSAAEVGQDERGTVNCGRARRSSLFHPHVFLGRALQRDSEDPAIGGCCRVNGLQALAAVSIVVIAEPGVLGNSLGVLPRMTRNVIQGDCAQTG